MILLSVICQFGLAILFAKEVKEALSNKQGNLCLIKCALATIMYFSLGMLLTWLLVTHPVKIDNN